MRESCQHCERPLRICICEALPSERLCPATLVLCWQHPAEAKRPLASQTAQILKLCLASDCFGVATGRYFSCLSQSPLWDRTQRERRRVLILWPTPDAPTLGDALLQSPAGTQFALVVVDGTWKEAREMMQRDLGEGVTAVTLGEAAAESGVRPSTAAAATKHAALWAVAGLGCLRARVRKHHPAASAQVFAVRKPPARGCLSTLESVGRALDCLDGPSQCGPPLSHALLRPMLRVAELQHELSSRVVHRPERPGYRPQLWEEVAHAASSLERMTVAPEAATGTSGASAS